MSNAGQERWQKFLTDRFGEGALMTIAAQEQSLEGAPMHLVLPPQAFEFTPDDDSEIPESDELPGGMLRVVAVDHDSEFPMGFTVDTSDEGSVFEHEVEDGVRVIFVSEGRTIMLSSRISETQKQMVQQLQQERGN